jgi:redox-sensitive bicupin YhaK (pirin superfamily)
MQTWDLTTHDVQPHQPEVLDSHEGAARTLLIHLPAGERLQEHETKERAYYVVASGEVTIGGRPARAGTLAVFEAHERRELEAQTDARILLLLAPWPASDHGHVRDDAAAESRSLG